MENLISEDFVPAPYESYDIDTNVKPKVRRKCQTCEKLISRDRGFTLLSPEGVIKVRLCATCASKYSKAVMDAARAVQKIKPTKVYVVKKKKKEDLKC